MYRQHNPGGVVYTHTQTSPVGSFPTTRDKARFEIHGGNVTHSTRKPGTHAQSSHTRTHVRTRGQMHLRLHSRGAPCLSDTHTHTTCARSACCCCHLHGAHHHHHHAHGPCFLSHFPAPFSPCRLPALSFLPPHTHTHTHAHTHTHTHRLHTHLPHTHASRAAHTLPPRSF